MKKVTIAYCKRCGYIRIDVKKASRCMYCDNDFTLLSLPIKDYKKRMSTSEGLQEIKQEIFDQYIKDNPEYDIRIVNIKEHNGDKIQYCTTCGNIELNNGIVLPARRDRYIDCEFCGSPYITTDKYFTDILDKESYTSEDFYMVQKYIFKTYNIKNNPNYSQKKRDERIIAFNKRNKEIGLKHDWEYKEYTEPYSEADLSESYGTIQYCPTCGYIDLSHKTDKLCPHCSSLISDTGEWLKDYIAKGEFANTDDIEYKVRIKEIEQQIFNKYIKDNPQLNETLMNDRLLNEIHGDKQPEPQPQEVYHAPTPEPDTRPRCPICGSTNIHKISAANKIGSAAMFGVLAAGHVSKTFKCDHCGAKF